MATYYVTQSGAGSQNGSSLGNAWSVSDFNTAGNWSSPSIVAGKISPGDTVILSGTFTSTFTIQASGTVGNVITILFDVGAKISTTAWTTLTGAFNLVQKSYITIDGGATGRIGGYLGNPLLANGIIEATDNGTNLGLQRDLYGVFAIECSKLTVKNLLMRNLFVRVSGPGVTGDASGIFARWNGSLAFDTITVDNNVMHDVGVGFYMSYGPSTTAITYSNNTVYNCNWGGGAGDGGSSAVLDGLVVSGNYFHSFSNWDGTDGPSQSAYHHNGYYVWGNEGSGGECRAVSMFNNVIEGPYSLVNPNGQTSGLFCSGSEMFGPILIYNNLFIQNASDGGPSNGLIFLWIANTGVARVYNNTFVGDGVSIAIGLYGANMSSSGNYYTYNNLAINKTFISFNYKGSAILASNNNLGYNLKSGEEYSESTTGSSAFKTFAQWQALGYDANSINAQNPLLTATYHLSAGSPAINAGANESLYFTTDADGFTRTIPWDIGAYAYLQLVLKRLGGHIKLKGLAPV